MSVASPEHTSRELEEHLERLRLDGPVGDDELERFRNEWRAEVKSRKPAAVNTTTSVVSTGKAEGIEVKPTASRPAPAFTAATATASSPKSSKGAIASSARATVKGKELEAAHGPAPRSGTSFTSPQAATATLPRAEDQAVTSPARSSRSLSPATSPRAIRTRPLDVAEAAHDGSLGLHTLDASISAGPSRSPERPRTVRPPGGRPAGKAKGDAVTIYARAVEAEQAGQLNDALNLYRQAFKMDDNVDRLYAHHRFKIKPEPITPTSTDLVSADPPTTAPYTFQRTIQTAPDYDPHHAHGHPHAELASITGVSTNRLSPLTALLRRADPDPSSRPFAPANEDLPVPIDSLPSEVFEHVLHHLDLAGIESFGSTCWRARWLTAHSEEWKRRAERIYSRPALNPEEVAFADMGRRHEGEWRTVLVERERVRMDGCYIAVCHYIRPGAGDEWVTITHMITYHRFLRFYPDGTVLSFLTTDHPSEVVPMLKPTLRAKGLHIGTYTLAPVPSADPNPNSAPDAKANVASNRRIIISELLEPGNPAPKYEFEMELSLRETGRGRWNKLDITSYQSVNLATGEVLGLALKHQKPFYFSKVRSYQPAL